jgi:hypothetical protein
MRLSLHAPAGAQSACRAEPHAARQAGDDTASRADRLASSPRNAALRAWRRPVPQRSPLRSRTAHLPAMLGRPIAAAWAGVRRHLSASACRSVAFSPGAAAVEFAAPAPRSGKTGGAVPAAAVLAGAPSATPGGSAAAAFTTTRAATAASSACGRGGELHRRHILSPTRVGG